MHAVRKSRRPWCSGYVWMVPLRGVVHIEAQKQSLLGEITRNAAALLVPGKQSVTSTLPKADHRCHEPRSVWSMQNVIQLGWSSTSCDVA